MVKNPPAMQETRVRSLGQEDLLEKGMATHSSILAWRIPWTEEPGMQCMQSQRVGHDWATNNFTFFTFSAITDGFLHSRQPFSSCLNSFSPHHDPLQLLTTDVRWILQKKQAWSRWQALGVERLNGGAGIWHQGPVGFMGLSALTTFSSGMWALEVWGIILVSWGCDYACGNRKGKVYETKCQIC